MTQGQVFENVSVACFFEYIAWLFLHFFDVVRGIVLEVTKFQIVRVDIRYFRIAMTLRCTIFYVPARSSSLQSLQLSFQRPCDAKSVVLFSEALRCRSSSRRFRFCCSSSSALSWSAALCDLRSVTRSRLFALTHPQPSLKAKLLGLEALVCRNGMWVARDYEHS